jgi:hypothetical protein
MKTITTADFLADTTGRRFADVLNDPRVPVEAMFTFFGLDDTRRRMRDAEMFHGSPALAGVVREFERFPEVDHFFRSNDGHTTRRVRQAIGVLVRMTMEASGWKATGRKGTLGRRAKVKTPTAEPGAYFNETGIARWFVQTERYVPCEGTADHAKWVKLWP